MIDKVYFPNLNGLRFFAALLVIIHHIEQLKYIYRIDGYWTSVDFIGITGRLGVVLFFVLSGFLITYLLLNEEKNKSTINIKTFYIRRALRIWPLYFLIIILALWVLPNIEIFKFPEEIVKLNHGNILEKIFLFILFLPNLHVILYGIIPYASQTWSIGTEEQFYLIWPFALIFFKRNRISLMLTIIIGYTMFRYFLAFNISNFIPYKSILTYFWGTFNIDCMAIGSLFAMLLFKQSKYLKYLMRTDLFYGTLILTITLIGFGFYFPYFHLQFYAVLFGIVILNFASNKSIKISLENRLFNYLGKISYGLYMYHSIAIVLAIFLSNMIEITSNWLLYPLSLSITIFLASISYQYFEFPFLKHKEKFSTLK